MKQNCLPLHKKCQEQKTITANNKGLTLCTNIKVQSMNIQMLSESLNVLLCHLVLNLSVHSVLHRSMRSVFMISWLILCLRPRKNCCLSSVPLMAHMIPTPLELASSSGTYGSKHDERDRKKQVKKQGKLDREYRGAVVQTFL